MLAPRSFRNFGLPTLTFRARSSCHAPDPRCHPESIFNLDPSDLRLAATVIRVQGGDFQTALPAVLAIDHLIKFNQTILMKHTDCGSIVFRDADIKAQLKARALGSATLV